MGYKLTIKPWVYDDIQNEIDRYNAIQKGLGRRFHSAIRNSYKTLKINPHFQVRYDEIRCLPVKKFPYMIHFIVEEDKKRVVVLAVINTSRDPGIWNEVVNR